jgi:hypothetical protein
LSLEPEHIWFDALSLEEGTRRLLRLSPRVSCALPTRTWRLTCRASGDAVSAFLATSTTESRIKRGRHSTNDVTPSPILAISHTCLVRAGAHSRTKGCRWANAGDPKDCVALTVSGPNGTEWQVELGFDLKSRETMMLGPRLVQERVAHNRFRTRFRVALAEKIVGELREVSVLGLGMTESGCRYLSTPGPGRSRALAHLARVELTERSLGRGAKSTRLVRRPHGPR